jgi:hypothetical protein
MARQARRDQDHKPVECRLQSTGCATNRVYVTHSKYMKELFVKRKCRSFQLLRPSALQSRCGPQPGQPQSLWAATVPPTRVAVKWGGRVMRSVETTRSKLRWSAKYHTPEHDWAKDLAATPLGYFSPIDALKGGAKRQRAFTHSSRRWGKYTRKVRGPQGSRLRPCVGSGSQRQASAYTHVPLSNGLLLESTLLDQDRPATFGC